MDPQTLAAALAEAALAGPLATSEIAASWARCCGQSRRWMQPLARRLVAHFGEYYRPRRFRVIRFLLTDAGFEKVASQPSTHVVELPSKPRMCPAGPRASCWEVQPLRTTGDLARWLTVPIEHLAWLADVRTLEGQLAEGPLRHYRYRWIQKRDGSARLLEAPKPRLKAIQRQILAEILDRIPPHPAVHGFRAGHSIRSFVAPHTARALVLRLDLRDFFPGVLRARILAIFLTAGYPEAVATLLTGLCTNTTPRAVLESAPAFVPAMRRRLKLLYARPHLPQGAPTSPALANLAAWRFDVRLAGLAEASAAAYTRYADDLLFSGDPTFARGAHRFAIHVGAIALEEGFEVNWRKVRHMRPGVAQRAAGLVLNAHVNIPRADFDHLKAILYNCVRHGPATQNRAQFPDFRAHLAGRLAHCENIAPIRAIKLRRLFEQIDWNSTGNIRGTGP